MITMCILSVVKLNIEEIAHVFLESGHTQNEGDSVHARIERSTKDVDIYHPSEWVVAVKLAKKEKPKYSVREIETEDIYDFNALKDKILPRRLIDDEGNPVKVSKIKYLEFKKARPGEVGFKYNHNESTKCLKLGTPTRQLIKSLKGGRLSKAYIAPPNISVAKYNDLMNLCKKNIIPPKYHSYYNKLKPSTTIVERLPETDKEDSESCTSGEEEI